MKGPKPLQSSFPHKPPVLGFAGPFALRGAKSRRRTNPVPSQAKHFWAGLGPLGRSPRRPATARDVPALRDDVSAPVRAGGGVGLLGQEAQRLR